VDITLQYVVQVPAESCWNAGTIMVIQIWTKQREKPVYLKDYYWKN